MAACNSDVTDLPVRYKPALREVVSWRVGDKLKASFKKCMLGPEIKR